MFSLKRIVCEEREKREREVFFWGGHICIPNSTQGLFMALYSGITPDGVEGWVYMVCWGSNIKWLHARPTIWEIKILKKFFRLDSLKFENFIH